LSFDVLKHLPYSPDLASSDYQVFGPPADAFRGRHYTSDQQLKEVIMHGLLAN
jgi:hypothetical protein